MKKVKTLVIGLGNIGLLDDIKKSLNVYTHSKSLFSSKKFNLSAAIDINKKKKRTILKKL